MNNNFMPTNMPHSFYNAQAQDRVASNYSYEINLNAVNKSLGNNGSNQNG